MDNVSHPALEERQVTALPIIVTDTLLEQVLTAVLFSVFWIHVNAVNGFLIYLINKTNTLYDNVHYTLLSVYLVCDIIATNVLCVQVLPATITNNLLVFTAYYCRILSSIGIATYCTSIYMLAYIALERLLFFRYPLKYNRYFTKSKIIITFLVVFSLMMIFSIVVDVIYVRRPVAVFMTCVVVEGLGHLLQGAVIILVYVPTMGISIFTLINLGMLVKTHQARIYPMTDNIAIKQPIHNFLTRVRKHIRLLLSISGTFWLTIIPGMLIHINMSSSDATFQDINTRSNMTMFLLAKIGRLLKTIIPCMLNPFIYVYLLPDLRQAVTEILRWK